MQACNQICALHLASPSRCILNSEHIATHIVVNLFSFAAASSANWLALVINSHWDGDMDEPINVLLWRPGSTHLGARPGQCRENNDFVYKNIKFQVWDLGGQTSIRPYWRCYYPNTQAIIYVVDSTDTERIGISKEEFHAILEEEELRDALILVYANKQDLPGALSDAEIAEGMGLHDIKSRDWAIFKTSAVRGEGLFEGLDWLTNTLKSKGR
ncbi:uncharacterized protein HaLaN_03758 [Haematococcus lacustris]|uniref:ADP-ribosylation factor-like protein 1 n=1 Tax=Haematococcus lacustris TaxID=44745 RepID=A0A699YH23_HAELA|nr:uncharacterized protein HaLaN_03758 [Haematococcus lacustris]